MKQLQIFENPEFGQVRTIEENGQVLFCGKDVATALGYAKPENAIARHCPRPLKRGIGVQTGTKADGTPAMQTVEMNFITEGDIYRLAAKSELPGAERFESWIFDEVLPSIRRTGGYITGQNELSPEELMAKALLVAQNTLAQREARISALLAENAQQKQLIEDFRPVQEYIDTILSSEGTLATSQIAADYDLSATRLNRILHEEGIQRSVNGQWILYSRHMGKGFTKSKTFHFNHTDGRPDTRIQTQWTQKGRLLIHEILTRRGILAVMDRRSAM